MAVRNSNRAAGKYRAARRGAAKPGAAVTVRIALFAALICLGCVLRFAESPALLAVKDSVRTIVRSSGDYVGAVQVLGRAISGKTEPDENAALVFGRKVLGLEGDSPTDPPASDTPSVTTPPVTSDAESPDSTIPAVSDETAAETSDILAAEHSDETDAEQYGEGGFTSDVSMIDLPATPAGGMLSGRMFSGPAEAPLPLFTPSHRLSVSLTLDEGDDTTPNEPFEIPSPDNVDDNVYKLPFKYVSPVRGAITSYFGYRVHPISGETTFHFGADVGVGTGTAVGAFADGKVQETGYTWVYGNYMKVSHADGFVSFYAHLSKIEVKTGKSVSRGDRIAKSGNTGYSTGAHLHFELLKDGKRLNPFDYLSF